MEKSENLSGDENIVEHDGAKAINNFDEERVQLLFDEKPTAEIIKDLKGRGWRWSPSRGVWQRKNTPMAVRAAESILSKHFGERLTASSKDVAEFPKTEDEIAKKNFTPEEIDNMSDQTREEVMTAKLRKANSSKHQENIRKKYALREATPIRSNKVK